MSAITDFLTQADAIFAAGIKSYEDAKPLLSIIEAVRAKGAPEAADWDALHAFEAKATADLDAPMEGEI